MVIPGNLASCPRLFPATLRSSVLSFLLQFNPYSFSQNSQKNSSLFFLPLLIFSSFFSYLFSLFLFPFFLYFLLFFPSVFSAFFSFPPFLFSDLPSQRSLLQPPFPPPFLPHSFCLQDPLPESSSMCQSPTATSKSEVDSLWPLRMWHMARWNSDTWLKMWYAKTNREKGDPCLNEGLHYCIILHCHSIFVLISTYKT